MTAALPRSVTAIAECRAILGGSFDPMRREWDGMTNDERGFWLGAARLNRLSAGRLWTELSGDEQCRIKSALYRAAKRAELILRAAA